MIHCENLSKTFIVPIKKPGFKENLRGFFKPSYKTVEAVREFSLDLPESGLVGLLGPNGSGKTTLMKMFTGIIVPTKGRLRVLQQEPKERPLSFRKRISLVMGQKTQLSWDLTAMDSFLLFQKYYEIKDSVFKSRLGELSERLHTSQLFHTPMRKLSLGERMKMELMACLLHDPEVIFLDEPTIGLDVKSQQNTRAFLKEYYTERKPLILLTSHYMGDVEALCEKIIIIIKGEKYFEGEVKDFKNRFKEEKSVVFHFERPVSVEKGTEDSLRWVWKNHNREVKIYGTETQIKDITIKILNDYPVSGFHTEDPGMEDIMARLLSNPDRFNTP